jgi:hypothetical protein
MFQRKVTRKDIHNKYHSFTRHKNRGEAEFLSLKIPHSDGWFDKIRKNWRSKNSALAYQNIQNSTSKMWKNFPFQNSASYPEQKLCRLRPKCINFKNILKSGIYSCGTLERQSVFLNMTLCRSFFQSNFVFDRYSGIDCLNGFPRTRCIKAIYSVIIIMNYENCGISACVHSTISAYRGVRYARFAFPKPFRNWFETVWKCATS